MDASLPRTISLLNTGIVNWDDEKRRKETWSPVSVDGIQMLNLVLGSYGSGARANPILAVARCERLVLY